MEEFDTMATPLVDFGYTEDKTKNIIKVIGVGGGGCNAVKNMYNEGITNVTFAVCNTDSQSLAKSPIPVKVPIGDTGLGAGADPKIGKAAAELSIDSIKRLLDDGTKMVFVTAGMGGGTGTGAAPVIAGAAKGMGILTIGIVTIPFYFEKKRKIIKALKGVEEMRRNVDALLIINNERICDIYTNSEVTIKNAFRRADQILCDATKSISELITVEGDINLDFCDVETTLRGGGGAIMAMGRAGGEHRVQKAIIDALDSPLLYGNDIDKARRILFNIYTSEKHPLFVREMTEIDAFMDALDPNIDVIWGVSDDNSLDEDAKVTILATGFADDFEYNNRACTEGLDEDYFESMIGKLYKSYQHTDLKTTENVAGNTAKCITRPVVKTDINGIPVTVYAGGEAEEQEDTAGETTAGGRSIANELSATSSQKTVSAPERRQQTPENGYERTPQTTSLPQTDGRHEHERPSTFQNRMKELMKKITELTQDPEEK